MYDCTVRRKGQSSTRNATIVQLYYIVQEHFTLLSGRKTALVVSLCVRVCVSFLFHWIRWSFDQLVDNGVIGGLSESSKEKG